MKSGKGCEVSGGRTFQVEGPAMPSPETGIPASPQGTEDFNGAGSPGRGIREGTSTQWALWPVWLCGTIEAVGRQVGSGLVVPLKTPASTDCRHFEPWGGAGRKKSITQLPDLAA